MELHLGCIIFTTLRLTSLVHAILFIGHSSMIYFVDDVGPSPLAQSVAFRDLPLRDVGPVYF
jgi:hypothetical protein